MRRTSGVARRPRAVSGFFLSIRAAGGNNALRHKLMAPERRLTCGGTCRLGCMADNVEGRARSGSTAMFCRTRSMQLVLPAERAKVERKASVPFFFFFFLSRHKGNTLVMRVLASHCIYHSPYNWLPPGRVLKGVVPLSFVSCPRLWPFLSI